MPRRKKAHELTNEQVLRRLFPKEVRKHLKRLVEHVNADRKPSKSRSRKVMKGR